jgi:signal transduction histidine kinase
VLQILANLLHNAIKFTPPGGGIEVRVARGEDVHGRPEARIAVADSGVGIDAVHLPHVFDRYWKASAADRQGAGLGLAISKAIAEAHGGGLRAESALGKGSTFCLSLPVLDEEERLAGAPPRTEARSVAD